MIPFISGYMHKTADYSDVSLSDLYDAVAEIETGAYENPYVRSKNLGEDGLPSSAWGRVQLGKKLLDAVDPKTHYGRWIKEKYPQHLSRIQKAVDHRNRLMELGDPSHPDHDPRYLPGGPGDDSPRLRAAYNLAGNLLAKKDWEDSNYNPQEFVNKWYGSRYPDRVESYTERLTNLIRPPEGYVIVRGGDTLSGIAQRYKTTVDEILRLNPSIKNKDIISIGKRLTVPRGSNE